MTIINVEKGFVNARVNRRTSQFRTVKLALEHWSILEGRRVDEIIELPRTIIDIAFSRFFEAPSDQ